MKAYEKVSWDLMFTSMEKMGMIREFINMVIILFITHTFVIVNDGLGKPTFFPTFGNWHPICSCSLEKFSISL